MLAPVLEARAAPFKGRPGLRENHDTWRTRHLTDCCRHRPGHTDFGWNRYPGRPCPAAGGHLAAGYDGRTRTGTRRARPGQYPGAIRDLPAVAVASGALFSGL